MKSNKKLVIIGPGNHFAKDIAEKFYSHDFESIFIGRNKKDLDVIKKLLSDNNIQSSYFIADVTKVKSLEKAFSEISVSGSIDCIIYNVKASTKGTALEIKPNELLNDFSTNVVGALISVQSAITSMNKGGSIILTGGGYKDKPDPKKASLAVSKGALHSLFLSLKIPLESKGILIKTVVIDGMVGESIGNINPNKVAEQFWKSYLLKSSGDTSIIRLKS